MIKFSDTHPVGAVKKTAQGYMVATARVARTGVQEYLASELGFTLTAYKNWGALSLTLATITSTIVTFAWDLFQSGYAAYNFSLLVSLFIIRLLSIGFFAGLLVYLIKALLNKSGLVR